MSEFPLVNVEPAACGHAPGLHYKGRSLDVDAFQKLLPRHQNKSTSVNNRD
ncbi:hypothetical protein [Herbaspirillum huttiense]|uniref:hypothetical protein n=1 Tax=Herbaspirillum huttiense TaxID=863372 RepID=UPI00131F1F1B|nr:MULTISPECIES: hypothetical protein [Herbaspirillum]UWE16544.1 hypothetical protein NY669_26325 [Herbaspirillum huttiense]